MAFTTEVKWLVISPPMEWAATRATEAEAQALAEATVDEYFTTIHILPTTTYTHVEE